MICLSLITDHKYNGRTNPHPSLRPVLPQFLHLLPTRPPRLQCPSSRSGFRHPRSHVDDLVSAELLEGISLLLPADTDLQTPLEGELGLNLLLLARSRSVLCCVLSGRTAELSQNKLLRACVSPNQTKKEILRNSIVKSH